VRYDNVWHWNLELGWREWQPKDYESFGFNSPQGFSNYLTGFFEMKLLEREKRGRETLYTPRGDVKLHYRGIPDD